MSAQGYVWTGAAENNDIFDESNWPADVLIKDSTPKFGNPDFVNPGGDGMSDYIPQNTALIVNKGIEIPLLPGDDIGLLPGLAVKFDILGNKIVGQPDMGANEISDHQN